MSAEEEFIEELKKYIQIKPVEEAVKRGYKFSFSNDNFEVKAEDENHILVSPCRIEPFLDDRTIAFERKKKLEASDSNAQWRFYTYSQKDDCENDKVLWLNKDNTERLIKGFQKIVENSKKTPLPNSQKNLKSLQKN